MDVSLRFWVSSPHNGSGYYGLKDEINDALSQEHFKARVQGSGDSAVEYARTGYLGFMMKSSTKKTGGKKTLPAYSCVVCVCMFKRLSGLQIRASIYSSVLVSSLCTQTFLTHLKCFRTQTLGSVLPSIACGNVADKLLE